jgi:hypothetical protein
MKRLTSLAVLLVGAMAALPVVAAHFEFSGNIPDAATFDLYVVPVGGEERVTALLTCAAPPNNTLDSILSMYAPGKDPSSTSNADFYDDDGGPDLCGGFRDSRLDVIPGWGGNWTFRVDGFGSSIGAYTLTIDTAPTSRVPTLTQSGLLLLGLLVAVTAARRLRRRS